MELVNSRKFRMELDSASLAKRAGKSEGEVLATIAAVKKASVPLRKMVTVAEGKKAKKYTVARLAVGPITTHYGKFNMFYIHVNDRWKVYEVLYKGLLDGNMMPKFDSKSIMMRIDSGCETGQKFGDLTCDCKWQLFNAMHAIDKHGAGMIVHIPAQEGRGLGITFKLGMLSLQSALGLNTVEASLLLAGNADRRDYAGVVGVLKFFGLPKGATINMLTNNPDKTRIFADNGYKVKSLKIEEANPNSILRRHYEAKRRYLGHKL